MPDRRQYNATDLSSTIKVDSKVGAICDMSDPELLEDRFWAADTANPRPGCRVAVSGGVARASEQSTRINGRHHTDVAAVMTDSTTG
jgi:hypothetical protein